MNQALAKKNSQFSIEDKKIQRCNEKNP